MTRDEAVKKLVDAYYCNEAQANHEIHGLELLGVLTLEPPKTLADRFKASLEAKCFGQYQIPVIFDALDAAGLTLWNK